MNYEGVARKIADSCRINTKPNPHIEKARKHFGADFIGELQDKKTIPDRDLKDSEKRKLKKLSSIVYGPLFYRDGDNWIIKDRIGEVIRIVYTDTDERCVNLAKEIRKEAWRRGCHVTFIPVSDHDSKQYFTLSPNHTVTELPPSSVAFAKSSDLRIFVGETEDPMWTRGLEKKLHLSSQPSQVLHDIYDKRGVRWAFVGFPVKRTNYIIDPKKYEQTFLKAFEETFSKRTLEICRYYEKALKGADKIKITAQDGTDLTFSIKGRPAMVADGVIGDEDMEQGDIGLNIPDGEVFVAPLEKSANGKILFDYISVDGFGFIKDLWLFFKKGKVVDFKGKKEHVDIFRLFLETNTGEKDRIAELGIGANPAAEFIGSTLVDEKIFGSIHIAIGNNTGSYHGRNKASSHQDMIKIMKGNGGNVYVDGNLAMKDGLPLNI